jgi:hypothetical protein
MSRENEDYDDMPDLVSDGYINEYMDEILDSLSREYISSRYSNLATRFRVNLRNNLDRGNYYDEFINNNLTDFVSGVFNMVSTIEPLNVYDDVLERVLQESLETHNQLVRTNDCVNFKKLKYCNIDSSNLDTSCSICLVDFEDESDISLTECSHIFHMDCITEWSRYKKDCPVCRKDLKNKLEKKEL